MSNANLPAFPPNAGWEHAEAKGLTKREYFAGLAMQGLLAGAEKNVLPEDLARQAVTCADSLIAELEKPRTT